MALGILGAMGVVTSAEHPLFVGELSLDGSVRPVRGALSITAARAKRGIKSTVVPVDNAPEAAVAGGVDVFGIRHLSEAVAFLRDPSVQAAFANGRQLRRALETTRFQGRARPVDAASALSKSPPRGATTSC